MVRDCANGIWKNTNKTSNIFYVEKKRRQCNQIKNVFEDNLSESIQIQIWMV